MKRVKELLETFGGGLGIDMLPMNLGILFLFIVGILVSLFIWVVEQIGGIGRWITRISAYGVWRMTYFLWWIASKATKSQNAVNDFCSKTENHLGRIMSPVVLENDVILYLCDKGLTIAYGEIPKELITIPWANVKDSYLQWKYANKLANKK